MVKRSEIWKHFCVLSKGKAECSYCQKRISFYRGATSNLGRHIRVKHSDIFPNNQSPTKVPPCKLVNFSKSSDTKCDTDVNLVERNHKEEQSLSFSGRRNENLGRHVRTQHENISSDCIESASFLPDDFVDALELPETKHTINNNVTNRKDTPKRSEIWKYFSIVSEGRAECSYCHQCLSFSRGVTSNLGRHIRKKHNNTSSDCSRSNSAPLYEFVNVSELTDSKDGENENKLIKGKDMPTRSEILNHFSIVSNRWAECGYCQKRISFSGGATSNLARHIHLQHRNIVLESFKLKSVSSYEISSIPETPCSIDDSKNNNPSNMLDIPLSPTVASQRTCPLKRKQYERKSVPTSYSKKIDEQLTKTILKQYYPLKMVEDPNFKEFIHMLCPNYELPTKATLSHSLIPSMFSDVKEKVRSTLVGVKAVCLTVYEWTSNTQECYMTISSHFLKDVDSKITLQSCLLACIPFSDSDSSENVGELLRTEVESWNLEEKVVCVVINNPQDIDAIEYNNWKHLTCVANTLNIILGQGMSVIEREIAKIRKIVAYFQWSSKATNLLNILQKELNLPDIKLKQDYVTRWNTTYEMISRAIRLKDAIVAALKIDKPELNCITEREWRVLEESAEVFKIFGVVAKEISDEKHASLSKMMLIVNAIRTHLIKIAEKSTYDEITNIVTMLQNPITQFLKNMESNELVTTATILDPRFKRYGFISQTNFNRCLDNIKDKLQSTSSSTTSENIIQTSTPQTQSPTSLVWEDFDTNVKSVIDDSSSCLSSMNEVDNYLSEALIKRTEDPFKWWHDRKHIYPRLYKMIHHLFCIVVTSVPCENVFSKAGLGMDERRSGLKPEMITQIVFLNHNL